ncbi:sensor histidine kinase [Marinobacter segnicrescens]|uniref:sensor histidine kinase n=1 Tax=Marinobacter segnicrescens TaxID=430453 RepID=UPI001FE015DB|nr:ATP-binding protein [Marinobacter segnicrescens]
MSADTSSPTSQSYQRGTSGQSQRLFRVYNLYRIVISLVLTGLLFVDPVQLDQPLRLAEYYQAGVLGYLMLNSAIGLMLVGGLSPGQRHITLSVLLDILIIHVLLFTSSGITNGLANLIIISVAAGNILTPSRMGLFYAALAAICSLAIAGWGVMLHGDNVDNIVRAGSLGILYFGAALILQSITRRMQRSEALADSRARSIIELEKINEQIIQRMRTGIVVTDQEGRIRVANAAAEELLFGMIGNHGHQSRVLPVALLEGLATWKQDPRKRPEPCQVQPASPVIQASFTRLDEENSDLILAFIEDLSKVTQQAQQMKLASLGRLTAGIAHEIRNPLGAISHAAQLMSESGDIPEPDLRMLEIIQRHSRRVNGIIENVLDLSRRRQADAQLVDLGQWLTDFVRDYQQSTSHQDGEPPRISLELPPDLPAARFDKSQIEQVLTNLCDNGLRYSKQQTGRATLTVRAGATTDGERAYVDVEDQGPGVAEEHRNSVFEPFFTTDKGGTGLGLYLARELCETNQAHLALLNGQSPGCCFRITFAPPGRLI